MDEQREPTTPAEAEKSFNWRALILWPVVMVLLYFLSLGPVSKAGYRMGRRPAARFFEAFYTPWFAVYIKTPLHKPMGWYMHLWVPDLFDEDGNY